MRLFLLLCLAMISCGGHAPPCSKATCNGCCSAQGICEPGVEAYACGASGVQCQVCNGGAMCQSGACSSPQGSGGGSVSGTGGGQVSGTGGGQVSGAGGGQVSGTGGGSVSGTGGGSASGTGGGSVSGTGGGTVGGTGGGTVGGTGGGTTGGTGGGAASGSCAATCAGCCSNGACLGGTDTFACGIAGAACGNCGIGLCLLGQCFGLGGLGGGSAHGDGGTGTSCTASADCEADLFETSSCMPERRTDGGYTGWTGGYCSSTCGTLGTCPGTGSCLSDGYCYAPCSTPGSGRGVCRSGYVCEGLVFTDGGVAPGGVCTPDCHYVGASCAPGRTCSALGYCQ